MWNCVEEVDKDHPPVVNYSSVKVFDNVTGLFYVYGGLRWPHNSNKYSTTCRPTADFFCLRTYPEPKWTNWTIGMRKDDARFSPFQETLEAPEDTSYVLPKLGALPALQDPVGTIIRDETATKVTYLLILGDPIGKEYESVHHPILLCINLKMNSWRMIHLKNCEKVPDGRARASMITIGEMRKEGTDVYLCVFGGVKEEDYAEPKSYLETFAVANLSKGIWSIPDGQLPQAIGPLGMHPGLERYKSEDDGKEMVLILKGAINRSSNGKKAIARATAEFSRAYLFNPRSRINQFTDLVHSTTGQVPSPAKAFAIQSTRTGTSSSNEYILITLGKQRRPNKFPRSPAEANDLYVRPQVQIWIGEIHDTENRSAAQTWTNEPAGAETDSDESEILLGVIKQSVALLAMVSVAVSSADESSSSDSSSSIGLSDILKQKAKRPCQQVLRKSGKTLVWRNMTAGRVQQSLQHLSESFRIEAAFLSGDLSIRFDPTKYSIIHQKSPKLMLLGCDHAYLGEVHSDVYNAIARISLLRLVEADVNVIGAGDESLSILDDDMVSAQSTPEPDTSPEDQSGSYSDDKMPVFTMTKDDMPSPDTELHQDGLFNDEILPDEPVSDVEFEDHDFLPIAQNCPEITMAAASELYDDNINPELVRPSTEEDTFLAEECELWVAADFEIEAYIQNIAGAGPSPRGSPCDSENFSVDGIEVDQTVHSLDSDENLPYRHERLESSCISASNH